MDFLRIYSIFLGVVAAGLAVYGLTRRKKKSADDIEQERRQLLGRVGRITDGNVLDVQESYTEVGDGKEPLFHELLIYQYEIAGVEYHCSQDVTRLRQWIDLNSCRLGLLTSVKYDPLNPGNSMVISELWNGLRS